MATENILMAAALTPGTTTIRNAASSRTCRTSRGCWSAMGARIDGIGSNVLIVHGRKRLGGART